MASPKHVATPIPSSRRGGGKGLELFTLGGVRLLREGTDETAKLGAKHLALLVYLFHEQRPMHPSEVFELLGRGQEDEKEMEALQKAVAWLREHVPGANLRLGGETIEALAGVRMDTHDVDLAIDGGDARAVAELYIGEFLEGFDSGCPAFDEWAQKERGRIKRAWSHAILAAARDSERIAGFHVAAQWWQVLVARAPMRPEAVAGLLNSLAKAGREEDAARAYAEYIGRLQQSGVAQPADAVKEVIAQHRVLKEIADGQITPVVPVAPAQPAPAPPPAPSPPPPPPVQDVPVIEAETIDGFESGAAPPVRDDAPTPPAPPVVDTSPPVANTSPPVASSQPSPPAGDSGEGAWDDLVGLTSQDDFDIPITRPKVTEPPSAGTPPVVDTSPPFKEPERKRRPVEDDEHLRQAREAAAAFVDSEYGRVNHKITGVRKQWMPVLQDWWKELEPWRERMWDHAIAGLEWLGRALMQLPPLLARGLKVTRKGATSALDATKANLAEHKEKTRLKRDTLQKEKGERSAAKKVKRDLAKAKKADTRRLKKEQAEAKRLEKEKAEAKRLEKEKAGLLEVDAFVVDEPLVDDAPPAQSIEEIAESEFEDFADTFAAAGPELDVPDDSGPVFIEPPLEDEVRTDDMLPEEFGGPTPVIEEEAWEPAAPAAESSTWDAELPAIEPWKPKRKSILAGVSVLPMLRRFWYAPLGIAAVVAAILFGPAAVSIVGGFAGDLPDRLPDVDAPSLPRVSIPSITIRTPSFVETSVSRIGELLAGPLLEESGEWILVADVFVDAPAGPITSDVLTATLEMDLAQASFFSVVPRERAIIARRSNTGNSSQSLSLDDALSLAEDEGYKFVLGAGLRHLPGNDSVAAADSIVLRVLNTAGDTLYGVAAEVTPESDAIATLASLSRAVRKRMGEDEEDIEASKMPAQFLSESPQAIAAYQRARMQLFAGRYAQAASSAQQAANIDPGFALAYRVLAEAEALRGRRTTARNALEMAFQLADGTTNRERLRILADWMAWDGRQTDAAVTYDELFYAYRDDVGALKSQAVMQRAIGARGGGVGNLRVAYSIDKYDWPPLDRVARYLGYRGRLPDVDSLVAVIESGN